MRKATQKSKLTNPGGGNVEIEGRLRTRRGEAPESEVATDKVSNNDSKQSAETERESTASPSRITRMLKYVPYLFLVGLMIASFVLAIRSESPANSSSSTGVCWDKKIRIRVIPDEACRTLYINMSMKTPFLLLIIYALVHAYLSQLTGMLSTLGRILGLVSGDAASCGQLKSWDQRKRVMALLGWDLLARAVWAGATAFPTFYSAYVLFMYMNDSFYSLFAVQALLSGQQLCINEYMTALFARRAEALDTALRYPEAGSAVVGDIAHWSISPGVVSSSATSRIGSAMIGMILFKLGFNIFVESICGEGTLVLRTVLFVLFDIATLVIVLWLDGSYSQISAPLVGRSRASAPATNHWSLASLCRARFGMERLFGVPQNKKSGFKHLWVQHIVIAVATVVASAGFLLASTAYTGERIC